MKLSLSLIAAATSFAALAFASIPAGAQTATDLGRPAAVLPVASEPEAKLVVYPPLPEALARGVVIVQFRAENFRIIPIFGEAARGVSPRVAHLHVTVDDRPGTWAHTSNDPIIVVGLTPGAHKFLIEVADPTHKILTSETFSVNVPERLASSHSHAH